ncbi:MAG TPA: glycosyltransferase family A protein [Thermoleophilaceae bacterium]|nr:glycosyltransferase family A protein [Thermoleophilaceae bacterium]
MSSASAVREPLGRAAALGSPEPKALTYSVIIPATDRPATMDRCLEAVRSAADAPDEVIVVDSPAGMGPAGARNLGAMRATGSVLVFVDSDVVVHPDAFTRLRAAFEADPELAAVFGSYDDLPSLHGMVSTFRNMLHHYVHQGSGGVATTFWAGLGAVRREAFVAVDGFDDWRFRSPSVEDIEFGLRLASAGRLIKLDPEIQGTHLKRWSLRTMLLTDLLYRGMPWTALMLERGPQAARLNLRGSHGVAAGAFALALAAVGLGRFRLAAPLALAYLSINMRFYDLMLRQDGPRGAIASVGLLAAHNVAALGSAPLGVGAFAAHRLRRSGQRTTRLVEQVQPNGEWPKRRSAGWTPKSALVRALRHDRPAAEGAGSASRLAAVAK